MKRYSQLTREQRYQIYALKKAGHSPTRNAALLDVDKSTISRELIDWSPEQISDWLQRTGCATVSHERIYQYVLTDKKAGGTLYKHLRCKKQRKKRYGARERRGQLSDRVSIEARPAIVAQRSRLGDWELDTIIGKGHKQAIVSLTEPRPV